MRYKDPKVSGLETMSQRCPRALNCCGALSTVSASEREAAVSSHGRESAKVL